MNDVPLKASVESIGYECKDGVERWSYAVTAGPVGAPDHLVAGLLWFGGRGDIEVEKIDLNGLDLPDDLARRLLIVAFRGLCGQMNELDGDVAQYVTPDCTKWISGKMYHADASRILRALAEHAKVSADFQSTMWVSQ